MTIEVRQLIVRAQVGETRPSAGESAAQAPSPAWQQRLRRELLDELKAWLRDQQQRPRER